MHLMYSTCKCICVISSGILASRQVEADDHGDDEGEDEQSQCCY